MIGRKLSHYLIESQLGKGGMGEVYLARDTRLDRQVAIKILPQYVDPDSEGERRFITEARAASALNHPNIVTVHDFDRDGEIRFLVMERIDGEPLSTLTSEKMALDRFFDLAIQITGALGAAHAAGIVHHDIKPANLMLTRQGTVKVVDFGLARRLETGRGSEPTETKMAVQEDHPTRRSDEQAPVLGASLTEPGTILGTFAYMAPEQLQGERGNARSDVFSLGILFFELLTGRRPFAGASPIEAMAAILRDPPQPILPLRPDLPPELAALIEKCLAKDPVARFADAGELRQRLVALREDREKARVGPAPRSRRWLTLAAAAGLLIALVLISFGWRERSRQSWLRENLPEIERLLDAEQPVEAWLLARRARELAPEDSQLQQTWANLTYPANFTSEPPGAELAIRTYKNPQADWQVLGTTPFAADLPYPLMRFRVRAAGYETFEGAPEFDGPELHFKLAPAGTVPEGMVPVWGGRVRYRGRSVELPDYTIDRMEVTNGDFARFLKEGGYRRPELWKFPFEEAGSTLSFDEAMARLVDLTGRPGPAGWSLGAFPEGQEEHPVEGISWYEAAAYAEFVGKSLPTVFHWKKAGMNEGLFSDILALSNFAGQGTKPVGSLGGIGPWGSYDMAGNVKEWCWNSIGDRRYILGASYLDASYLFVDPDARSPLERSPGLGMRLMQQNEPLVEAALAEVAPREVTPAVPADDPTFAIYSRLFDYDPAPLEAKIEAIDDSHGAWRKEKISVTPGSGKERLTLHLFLPKNARPPFQTMIFFPGADAVLLHSSRQLWMRMAEFWVRGGRALVYPIYQGTYERQFNAQGPNDYRDLVIQRTKEVKRTVDYLLSREDIEAQKIGFYGLSMGGNLAPHALATDPRLRYGVVFAAGLENWKMPPEVQTETFLPRVRQPFLFVGGRQDFVFPPATSQQPFFERLGSDDKKMLPFEGGHLPIEFNQVIRNILGWADEKMGPVRQK